MEKTKNKITYKQKLIYAVPAGIAPAFMFFFFGVADIFAANRDEFMFSFGDFAIWNFLFSLGIAIVISGLIILLPRIPSAVVCGLFTGISVMSMVQALFFNGNGSLNTDTGETQSMALVIGNAVLWGAVIAATIVFALLMHKKEVFKHITVILLLMVIVMMLTSFVMQIGEITRENQYTKLSESDHVTDPKDTYLTTEGLSEVSAGKNTVIFLIDKFDADYFYRVNEEDPEFFKKLEGFTYFKDNISLYSRTYPAVATMITGVDNDFSGTASEYFYKAYQTSPFLKDLKANGIKIKLYTPTFYSYREGDAVFGVADNTEIAVEYGVTHRDALVGNLIALSTYRYIPNCMKSLIEASTASFSGIVQPVNTTPMYELNDPAMYKTYTEEDLTVNGEGGSYIFIHLNGCHPPQNMDENGKRTNSAGTSAERQLKGCFKMIYAYIDELKKLGLYDDATIIITGDHPDPLSDVITPTQPRITALIVKPAGVSEGELKYSEAQVSQANLIPTVVKCMGIKTENDYGKSYFEIEEGEVTVRHHKFQCSVGKGMDIIDFEITGKGSDFDNWKIKSTQTIGNLYK